jgi:hypothetical protein
MIKYRKWVGTIAILAIVAISVSWILARNDGDEQALKGDSGEVTLAQLKQLDEEAGHPVYWAGPRENATYELTRTADGGIYIRYLPTGSEATSRDRHLSVGTYPYPHAYDTIRKVADRAGSRSSRIPGGGIATWSANRPRSAYIAFPQIDLQIEVYDPSPDRARELAFSGAIVRID